jgi:hypothetical protein
VLAESFPISPKIEAPDPKNSTPSRCPCQGRCYQELHRRQVAQNPLALSNLSTPAIYHHLAPPIFTIGFTAKREKGPMTVPAGFAFEKVNTTLGRKKHFLRDTDIGRQPRE